ATTCRSSGISFLTLQTADSYSLTQPSVKSRSDWRSRPAPASAGEPGSSPWTASPAHIGSLGNGFFTHWSLACCFLRQLSRQPNAPLSRRHRQQWAVSFFRARSTRRLTCLQLSE